MPDAICFTEARIYTAAGPIERGWLLVRGERIVDFGPGAAPTESDTEVRNCAGRSLLPGFIDLHIHGAAGHDMMDATPGALRAIAGHCARHGVTAFLPTTWSASDADIERALANLARVMRGGSGGARILGAHIEGPFLNPAHAGAQDRRQLRPVDIAAFARWAELAPIRLLSLAPELPGAISLIRHCRQQGIATSAAHSAASYDEALAAIDAGMRQVTHTFNAMARLHHRRPGLLGAALIRPQLRCEIIADGVHVHPAMARLLAELKGEDGLILVTDSVRGAGLPEGSEYLQDGRRVRCIDGAARLLGGEDDGALAGSLLTMDLALRNLREFTGKPLAALWPATSRNPARALNLDSEIGAIARDMRADLVLLREDGRVEETIVGGETVFRAET